MAAGLLACLLARWLPGWLPGLSAGRLARWRAAWVLAGIRQSCTLDTADADEEEDRQDMAG